VQVAVEVNVGATGGSEVDEIKWCVTRA